MASNNRLLILEKREMSLFWLGLTLFFTSISCQSNSSFGYLPNPTVLLENGTSDERKSARFDQKTGLTSTIKPALSSSVFIQPTATTPSSLEELPDKETYPINSAKLLPSSTVSRFESRTPYIIDDVNSSPQQTADKYNLGTAVPLKPSASIDFSASSIFEREITVMPTKSQIYSVHSTDTKTNVHTRDMVLKTMYPKLFTDQGMVTFTTQQPESSSEFWLQGTQFYSGYKTTPPTRTMPLEVTGVVTPSAVVSSSSMTSSLYPTSLYHAPVLSQAVIQTSHYETTDFLETPSDYTMGISEGSPSMNLPSLHSTTETSSLALTDIPATLSWPFYDQTVNSSNQRTMVMTENLEPTTPSGFGTDLWHSLSDSSDFFASSVVSEITELFPSKSVYPASVPESSYPEPYDENSSYNESTSTVVSSEEMSYSTTSDQGYLTESDFWPSTESDLVETTLSDFMYESHPTETIEIYPSDVTESYLTESAEIYSTEATEIYLTETTDISPTEATDIYSTETTDISPTEAAEIYSTEATEIYSTERTDISPTEATEIYSTEVTDVYSKEATEIYLTETSDTYSTDTSATFLTDVYPTDAYYWYESWTPAYTKRTTYFLPSQESSSSRPPSSVSETSSTVDDQREVSTADDVEEETLPIWPTGSPMPSSWHTEEPPSTMSTQTAIIEFTPRPSVTEYLRQKFVLTFNGECQPLIVSSQKTREFQSKVRMFVIEYLDLESDQVAMDRLACGSVKSYVVIYNATQNYTKDLSDKVSSGEFVINITLSGRNDSNIYRAYKVEEVDLSKPDDNSVPSGSDKQKLDNKDIVLIVLACCICAVLIIIGFVVCARQMYSKKYAQSFNLMDTPHANLKMEDFTLTQFPRQRRSYAEDGVQVQSYYQTNGHALLPVSPVRNNFNRHNRSSDLDSTLERSIDVGDVRLDTSKPSSFGPHSRSFDYTPNGSQMSSKDGNESTQPSASIDGGSSIHDRSTENLVPGLNGSGLHGSVNPIYAGDDTEATASVTSEPPPYTDDNPVHL